MKHLIALAVLGLTACGCACTDSSKPARSAATRTIERAEVTGTVLDRSTGAVVAGAELLLPDGRRATSDKAGRFQFKDLDTGLQGALTARASNDREGRIVLRPLAAGRLEVVVFVGR